MLTNTQHSHRSLHSINPVPAEETAFLTGKRHYHHVRAIDVSATIVKLRPRVVYVNDLVISAPDLTKACAVLSWRWDLSGDEFCHNRHKLVLLTPDNDEGDNICQVCRKGVTEPSGETCTECGFSLCSACKAKGTGLKSVNLRSALLEAFSAGFRYLFCDIISINQSSADLISDVQALLRLYETIPVITSYGEYTVTEHVLNLSIAGASRGWINREMECMANNKLTLHNPSSAVLDKLLVLCLGWSLHDPILRALVGVPNHVLKYVAAFFLLPLIFLRHWWLRHIKCRNASKSFLVTTAGDGTWMPWVRIKEQTTILYLLIICREYRGLLYYLPFCMVDIVLNAISLVGILMDGANIGMGLYLGLTGVFLMPLLCFSFCVSEERIDRWFDLGLSIFINAYEVVAYVLYLIPLLPCVPLLLVIVLSGIGELFIWLGPVQPASLLSLRLLKDKVINRASLNTLLMNSADPFTTFSDLRFIRDVQMNSTDYVAVDKKALGVRIRINHLSIALDQLREVGKVHIPSFEQINVKGVEDPLPSSLLDSLNESHEQLIRDTRLLLFQKPDVAEGNYVEPITQDRDTIMGQLFRNRSIRHNVDVEKDTNKGWCCC